MTETKHVTVPQDTRAYICATCGAVALDAHNVCKVSGRGTKADWCGINASKPPKFCRNNVNEERWQCQNCGMTSVNPDLLCDPVKLDIVE